MSSLVAELALGPIVDTSWIAAGTARVPTTSSAAVAVAAVVAAATNCVV